MFDFYFFGFFYAVVLDVVIVDKYHVFFSK